MNIGKFDGMYKLLFDYKHEINKNIPDKLKCAKCKNVLINACQVPCGCRYCCDCVNKMLENGVVYCPGNADDCKEEYLSNNQLDFRANKAISKLVVKCPEETCLHECELIKIKEHLRICGRKNMKCPFAYFGCDNNKMAIDLLNEHCQSSNFNHCKILIEMIDNIRNEIDSLKIKEVDNEIKIEKIENELKVKIELIDSVNEEVKLVKLENENLKQQFELLKENIYKKFEEISKETKNEFNKQLIEMKIEKDKIKQECKEMKEKFERKTEEIVGEMHKENQERIKSINGIKTEENSKSEMMETKINEMNGIIDKFGYAIIDWTIDKLDERKNNSENIFSDYFTSKTKPYKLQLSFWANGWNDFRGKGCSIFLRIYSDTNDDFLMWPFKSDITIKVVNKTHRNLHRSITKYCKLNKPPNNSYCSSDNSNPRIRFDFSYDDLTRDGLLIDNCYIVKCFANFK